MPEKEKEKYVRICPKCRSVDVSIIGFSTIFSTGMSTFRCNNCSFVSKVFPEASVSEIEKSMKEPHEKKE